jgi:hypothetical protein
MKNKKLLIGLGVLAAAGITIYLVTRKKDEKKSNFITDKNKPKKKTKKDTRNYGHAIYTKSLYE